MMLYIIMGAFALLSSLVGRKLKSKFKQYSQVYLQNGMTGAEIAQQMLNDHGIHDVKVISTPGQLTDHYNPANKTVNLSEVVYSQRNAAAAAVAAHEVGHAVQHATAYSMLQFRSKMVPAVNIASKMQSFIFMAGIGLSFFMGNELFLLGAIAIFGVTTLFAFVTLPVEFDASNRALAWLEDKNMVTPQEYDGAADALKWAARTYVVAALSSLAQLLYFIMQFLNRR